MADIHVKVTTTRDYSCKLSRLELLKILNDCRGGVLAHVLPEDTEMTITVPSGGDFSGDSLDLDDAGGLQLNWREAESK